VIRLWFLFTFLESLPFSSITSVLAIILVTTFFVTSSDSGSLVKATLASGGDLTPPLWQRFFWAGSGRRRGGGVAVDGRTGGFAIGDDRRGAALHVCDFPRLHRAAARLVHGDGASGRGEVCAAIAGGRSRRALADPAEADVLHAQT
jgi:hypothetical protein